MASVSLRGGGLEWESAPRGHDHHRQVEAQMAGAQCQGRALDGWRDGAATSGYALVTVGLPACAAMSECVHAHGIGVREEAGKKKR